jgi:group I intron endonuclease
MYIYKFTHIETGRCYIGQTVQDPNRRRLEHVCHSNHSPKSYHFHNALNLYGVDAFTFEVIAEAKTLEELNSLEIKFIGQFDSINNGFNIRSGGNKKHSPESIERMKEAQKAAHARRRAEGKDTFVKTRKTAGWKWSKEQKEYLKEVIKQRKLKEV